MTISDIISNALIELGVIAVGQTVPAEHSAFCLNKINRLFDNWNIEGDYAYASKLVDFVLTPNHDPHTIGTAGSGADFIVTTVRPPLIEQADLVITDVTPNIYRPLKIVDDAWWMNNPVPTLATQIPYYLFPNYGWPKGELHLWPVPTFAYTIRLNIWTPLASVALTDTFTLPPGYEDAVTLSLAESLVTAFPNAPGAAAIAVLAQQARTRVKSMNSEPPTMACDPAAQSLDSRPRASIANFLSGFFN